MSSAVEVQNVSKTFKSLKAVDNLSFNAETAGCFGFLGPNGAGKTTLMQMIQGRCRRDNPSSSRINVFGFDPDTHALHIKDLSGVVPQEDNLDEQLNVFQNLLVYSKFYGLSYKEAAVRIGELLSFMEMEEKRKAGIKQLSGGTKRRLIIARALMHRPKLLMLDEPTTGLDPQVRRLIWEKLRELKSSGTTIILTTHYMEEAFQICDRVLIMDKGKALLEGAPSEMLAENIEPWVLECKSAPGEAALMRIGNMPGVRKDPVRTPPVFYAQTPEALQQIAEFLGRGEYHLRQSNLEDVFLNVTGRRFDAQ